VEKVNSKQDRNQKIPTKRRRKEKGEGERRRRRKEKGLMSIGIQTY